MSPGVQGRELTDKIFFPNITECYTNISEKDLVFLCNKILNINQVFIISNNLECGIDMNMGI